MIITYALASLLSFSTTFAWAAPKPSASIHDLKTAQSFRHALMSGYASLGKLQTLLNIPALNTVDTSSKEETNPAPVTIDAFLGEQAQSLEPQAANKVLALLQCVKQQSIPYQPILTVIDYHLPADQKRLWVFDLSEKKLLYHTYVSHGLKSGRLLTNYFSNRYNSKASSIGVYKTEKIYYGRQGLSLKLDGLDRGFNDNAQNRAIVMHGGWYVNEDFIKKYGRPGRSWGCPALPLKLTQPIINTIKDNTLFVVYYPDEKWMEKSKFLNCQQMFSENQEGQSLPAGGAASLATIPPGPQQQLMPQNQGQSALLKPEEETREAVLYVDFAGNHDYAEFKPLVVMSARNYTQFFGASAPLERMIRKQINQEEYVAISPNEFQKLALKYQEQITTDQLGKESLEKLLYFVTPALKRQRGYYVTDMNLVSLERLRELKIAKRSAKEKMIPTVKSLPPLNQLKGITENYTLIFNNRGPIQLEATKQFIRWLGL